MDITIIALTFSCRTFSTALDSCVDCSVGQITTFVVWGQIYQPW